MNNKGIGSDIAIIIILIVALLIAFLAMKNMGGFGFGSKRGQIQQENMVEQAQDAVDAINNRMQYSAIE